MLPAQGRGSGLRDSGALREPLCYCDGSLIVSRFGDQFRSVLDNR